MEYDEEWPPLTVALFWGGLFWALVGLIILAGVGAISLKTFFAALTILSIVAAIGFGKWFLKKLAYFLDHYDDD